MPTDWEEDSQHAQRLIGPRSPGIYRWVIQRRTDRWPTWMDAVRYLLQRYAEGLARDAVPPDLKTQVDWLFAGHYPGVLPAAGGRMQRSALVTAHALGLSAQPPRSAPETLDEQLLRDAIATRTSTPPEPKRDLDVLPRILLVHRNTLDQNEGVVTHLRLGLVPLDPRQNTQAFDFVRAPGSFLLQTDKEFGDAFGHASHVLRRYIDMAQQPQLPQVALAWDLLAPDPSMPVDSPRGPSAGGAIALAALYLLRRHVPPSLRRWLHLIDWKEVAITAALVDEGDARKWARRGGRLQPVAGVEHKVDAWFGLKHLQQTKVLVGPDQPAGGQKDKVLECANVKVLAKAAAMQSGEPLSGDEARLHDLLLHSAETAGAGEATGLDEPLRVIDRELLRRVAGLQRQRRGLRAWLLWRYASDSLREEDTLIQNFVNLRLASPDKRDAERNEGRPDKSLAKMLTAHPEAPGWLLTGMPGAGKTTLLRRYALARARDALRSLDRAEDPQEICLLIDLSDYPAATADAGKWLDERWKERQPGMPPLAGLQARHHFKCRYLFDGINEIDTTKGGTREQAVDGLARWAKEKGEGEGMLPPIFSIRELERAIGVGVKDFTPRMAHVEPLTEAQQQVYLQRRLKSNWRALWEPEGMGPDALQQLRDLCSLPMNLDYQCMLFDPAGIVATRRADLFSGLVWLRLRREQKAGNLHAPGLIDADDRRLLLPHSDWWETNLLDLPRGSELVKSLDRQGREMLEWKDNIHGNVRTIPLDRAAHWLQPERLRQDWLKAVQDLGLATVSDGPSHRKTFLFHHQLIGEFFAARDFSRAGPAAPSVLPAGVAFDPQSLEPLDRALYAAKAANQPLALPTLSAWEETMKLAVELAEDPVPLVNALADCNLLLAGRAAEALRAKADAQPPLQRLRVRLLDTCTDPNQDRRVRVCAGEVLGALGDTIRYTTHRRSDGTSWWSLPSQVAPSTTSLWVCLPRRRYVVGSDDEPRHRLGRVGRSVDIGPVSVSKLLVTVGEFSLFARDGGYEREVYWPTEAAQRWVAQSVERKRRRAAWQRADYMNPALPAVGVCFHEAQAYVVWLREVSRNEGFRLPDEDEWEIAARGGGPSNWPWDNSLTPIWQLCNCEETRLFRPSPVGVFSATDRRGTIADALGNVWEWTNSDFDLGPSHGGRNEQDRRKVIRGGCFSTGANHFPVSNARMWMPASQQRVFVGFRICCESPHDDRAGTA